nr:MAG TPA: hypothetical protein [Caudoviricetes sp.]
MGKKTRSILVLKNGKEIPITGITGRYYVTREAQYRKNSPTVKGVRAATDAECDALTVAQGRKPRRGKNEG